MISATLFGGLGNQMFIYAMIRAMSLRNDVSMAFNIKRGFEEDFQFKRSLELAHFNTILPESCLSTFNYKGGRFFKKISSMVKRNVLLPNQVIIEEKQPYVFQQELTCKKIKNAYLEGYWQSPRYFDNFADVIRNDFRIKTPIQSETIEELNNLKSKKRPLVMVGVRRYQEVNYHSFLKDHVCNAEFYYKAMKIVSEKIENPLFVVFSQDHNWVKANLLGKYDVCIAQEKKGPLSSISDMYLMQNCDAAIISNSTFYWWGAWLSNSKVVISSSNFTNKDCNCKGWIVI